jgi:protein arginine kinase
MANSKKLPNSFTSKMPWSDAKHPIWPATLFQLRRNLENRLFPEKLSLTDATAVLEEIKNLFSNYLTIPLDSLTPDEKELFFERFLLTEQFEKLEEARAFIVSEASNFLGIINLEDHLHLHLTSFENEFQTPFNMLQTIEKTVAKHLRFSYSSRFGYLTKDPFFCGTGFVVQAILHLPTLLHLEKFSQIIETLPRDITLKGLSADETYLADFVIVQNKYTLGVTEESILDSVYNTALILSEKELETRNNLKKEDIAYFKNKIARGYGLLKQSYAIETSEALNQLSMLHLGISLGLLESEKPFNYFDLFFSSARAHLKKCSKNKKDLKDNLCKKRAEFLRNQISSLDISLKNLYN